MTVSVEFLARYSERHGASYNRGERAGLPQAVAEDLAARGVVRLLLPEPGSKAPAGPPSDKMERGGKVKRKFL